MQDVQVCVHGCRHSRQTCQKGYSVARNKYVHCIPLVLFWLGGWYTDATFTGTSKAAELAEERRMQANVGGSPFTNVPGISNNAKWIWHYPGGRFVTSISCRKRLWGKFFGN